MPLTTTVMAPGVNCGLTVTGTGTGSLTVSGSTANLNAALASLIYRGNLNFSGSDSLSITATNGSVSATPDSVAINVVSAAQQAADLQAQVRALQSAGVLNRGLAALLKATLDLKGNVLDDLRVVAFLVEVKALRYFGILTQAQADALLGPGNILLLSVTRR